VCDCFNKFKTFGDLERAYKKELKSIDISKQEIKHKVVLNVISFFAEFSQSCKSLLIILIELL
jgi:hypothetical protein